VEGYDGVEGPRKMAVRDKPLVDSVPVSEDVERQKRAEELQARLDAIRERMDRVFAFQDPIDRTLEERVQGLESKVQRLGSGGG
jgi:hypothetical protein